MSKESIEINKGKPSKGDIAFERGDFLGAAGRYIQKGDVEGLYKTAKALLKIKADTKKLPMF